MPTFNQLVKTERTAKVYKSKAPILQKSYNSLTKEAELCDSEDRPCETDQRNGSHLLYPRHRPQPAGALRGSDPRRQGS